MEKPSTIRLSNFLSTETGKEFVEKVRNYVAELGNRHSDETGFRYTCASEALSFIESVIKYGEDDNFDILLDNKILNATADDVFACFDSWLDSEYCGDIVGTNDDSSRLEKISVFYEWSIDQRYGIPWSDCNN